jgi:hypothetical protein
MQARSICGQIETVALRHGSSGRFLGDIEGLYEGYRTGNPEEQWGEIPLANGTLALVLRHEIAVTRERGHNPFGGGNDPLANPPPGGPPLPPGLPSSFRQDWSPPPSSTTPPFQKIRHLRFQIDPAKSTGFYAGASGEMVVVAPAHRETGYLVVATKQGDLRLQFCEWVEQGKIVAELWIDGDHSTGIYLHASGDLNFALAVHPAGLAKGPYWGTLRLAGAS